jgi:hypothetical protein
MKEIKPAEGIRLLAVGLLVIAASDPPFFILHYAIPPSAFRFSLFAFRFSLFALTALCSRKAVPPCGSRYRVIFRAPS